MTYAEATDEGLTGAAASDDDATDVVEAAGHFRIYLGAAAGVGKTYAMLNEGHRRQQRGTDVVIGFVECHGRPLTEELCDGPGDRAPARRSSTGAPLRGDGPRRRARPPSAGGARRRARPHQRPRLGPAREALGGRPGNPRRRHRRDHDRQHPAPREHRRRRGADDRGPGPGAGAGLGRAQSRPDRARRLLARSSSAGGCCTATSTPQAKVPQALTHFFRTDNLIALRELALRFLADETEEELLEHLQRHQTEVAVGDQRAHPGRPSPPPRAPMPSSAAPPGWPPGSKATCTSSTSSPATALVEHDEQQLAVLRQLATDVGADWHEVQADDPAQALIEFARDHQITQIVVGSSSRSRWQELKGGGSIVRKISRLAGSRRDRHAHHRQTPSHPRTRTKHPDRRGELAVRIGGSPSGPGQSRRRGMASQPRSSPSSRRCSWSPTRSSRSSMSCTSTTRTPPSGSTDVRVVVSTFILITIVVLAAVMTIKWQSRRRSDNRPDDHLPE